MNRLQTKESQGMSPLIITPRLQELNIIFNSVMRWSLLALFVSNIICKIHVIPRFDSRGFIRHLFFGTCVLKLFSSSVSEDNFLLRHQMTDRGKVQKVRKVSFFCGVYERA